MSLWVAVTGLCMSIFFLFSHLWHCYTILPNWSEISQGVWNWISTFYLLMQSPQSFTGSNWLVVMDVCMISLRNTSYGSSQETVARVIKQWYKWKCLVHHGINHSQSPKKIDRTPTPDQTTVTLSLQVFGVGSPSSRARRNSDKTHQNSRSTQKQYVARGWRNTKITYHVGL